MKKIVILIVLIISGTLLKASNDKVIYVDDHIPDSFHQVIKRAIDRYEFFFGLVSDTFGIKVDDLPRNILAKTDIKNIISIDRNFLKRVSIIEFYDCIKHELYHTNTSQHKYFDSIYIRYDSVQFIGSYGLTLILVSKERRVLLEQLNEGCAEVCMFYIDSVYRTSETKFYYAYATIVRSFITSGWINVHQIMEYNKNSDLLGFCNQILGRQASMEEINVLFGYFTELTSYQQIQVCINGIKYLRENKL
ncbi:hypothetical protein A3C57_00780 [Candidatus Nomurabacteria bacterium RIFCSPHIGHO2_02_FULL_33_12]|uniref:Uncharacterized protein n=1 Tax=Candidatus Nomurabacteria bacterium RIFCSPLOWO2_01_FULL_33_17 TaxID=1801764 RepID=A0A1F6WQV3_9BACT|nr:MAG: hypothetical protein A3C57_00780 [Candidatus Nomurabacteria bacterium RIFCSPHIGHO2_02_FULL_33_12]OGI84268.1 MAG: hypothetical protein A2903_00120 [Candidatus Nomurabacteria bacterium RIFCSPLOWO2_01_FULL_33_17]